MYPLDRGLWGPTARITQIRDALHKQVRLDVVSGTRRERVGRLARFAVSGRLRGLDGIYVESSTALPGPIDIVFLALARLLRIGVVTYVRDAYQLFPEYYPVRGPRSWASRAAFRPAIRLLGAVSSRLAFPSRGLAAVLSSDPAPLLVPPGAGLRPQTDPRSDARSILYVGSMRQAVQGASILVEGIQRVRDQGRDVDLLCVVRPGEEPGRDVPSWVRIVRAEGAGIDRLLPEVLMSVIPRRVTPYNDLAVPIKLMDYLGYGRPVVVTATRETGRIVREAEAGVVVPDDAGGIARGIIAVLDADPDQRAAWARSARAAARANAWETRAGMILDALGVTASDQSREA
jgi:glycosyltransferase involved in cell wall biosynthesis